MWPLVWTPTVPVILTRVLGPIPPGHWAGPTAVRQQPTSCRTPTASRDLHPLGPMRAPEATWRGVGHLWALGQELSSPLSVLLTLRLTSGLEPVFCAAGGSQACLTLCDPASEAPKRSPSWASSMGAVSLSPEFHQLQEPWWLSGCPRSSPPRRVPRPAAYGPGRVVGLWVVRDGLLVWAEARRKGVTRSSSASQIRPLRENQASIIHGMFPAGAGGSEILATESWQRGAANGAGSPPAGGGDACLWRPHACTRFGGSCSGGSGWARLGSAGLGATRLGSAQLGSARLRSARLGSSRAGGLEPLKIRQGLRFLKPR
ncbi:unnamed protein product [Rangifer tarandus platyrhynchus]|uniref:Uncharacterized protein n=1 Tax=Rangifer tarandus platyrhynchus TaxID=3082113 RepID=A0ABN8YIN6_RANTA|nr:unnamed protein product [Rangifer tarandus platyrhynchus]